MSKWWARRPSSVFRAILIAAGTKAPEEDTDAAAMVWNSFYSNHQTRRNYSKISVSDIFMGGGTTLVEGARLGFRMRGNDLNPLAWLVVRNEFARVEIGRAHV